MHNLNGKGDQELFRCWTPTWKRLGWDRFHYLEKESNLTSKISDLVWKSMCLSHNIYGLLYSQKLRWAPKVIKEIVNKFNDEKI